MNPGILDPVLVLTPLLVLAAVLLLGFAGCDKVFSLDPIVEPTPFLTMRVRVPTALNVLKIVFVWDPPNTMSDSETLTKPPPSGLEGDDNLFDHVLTGEPDNGSWTVSCQVVVGGGTGEGAQGMGTFTLDGSLTTPVATFQATGPAAQLAVAYVGLGEA